MARHDPTDIGRRLAHRRHRAGITVEELADRSGVDAGYIRYLELSPDAEPTVGTLVRLASALGTSPAQLRGAGVDRPPGGGPAARHPVLRVLSDEECRRLLEPGGVGRVLVLEGRGPVALPVNFRVLDGDPVFRTAAGSPLERRSAQLRVSLEVDQIDEATSQGWSVVVSGTAHRISDPDELERARHLAIFPWAGGRREVYIRLVPEVVTGRRIEAA